MAAVEDPRVDRTKAHDLQDFLVLAVLCGADGWEYIELFADGVEIVSWRETGDSPRTIGLSVVALRTIQRLSFRKLHAVPTLANRFFQLRSRVFLCSPHLLPL
jgi:hypothetical protein